MRSFCLAVLVLLSLWADVPAQDAIPAATLTALKKATVFVKVQVRDYSASGSGFVIKGDGDSALVVTNHHVIEPKVKMEAAPGGRFAPPRFLTPRTIAVTLKNADVTVVFDSGTKNEKALKAEILAVDPKNDLAILRAKDADKALPSIDITTTTELSETMPVFTLGFPFGDSLATGKRSPAITVGKASISSLREDDEGELALVQIDGSLNPGNSGGPVVDAKGRLVGVAVATIRDSSGIGLAIPGGKLRGMLHGRLAGFHVLRKSVGGKSGVHVEAGAIDPFGKLASAKLYYVASAEPKGDSAPTALDKQAGVRKVALTLDRQLATAALELDGAVKDKGVLLQAEYDNGAGKGVKTKVVWLPLPTENVAVDQPRINQPRIERPQPGVPRPPIDATLPEGATNILGFTRDATTVKDQGPEGGVLVGFEVGLGTFVNRDVIVAFRAIYRTDKGETPGKPFGTNFTRPMTIKAKDGYAVAGLTANTSLFVNGFTVTFQRINGKALDAKDSYKSEWIGGRATPTEKSVSSEGQVCVGIVGKINRKDDCSAIGLLLKRENPTEGK